MGKKKKRKKKNSENKRQTIETFFQAKDKMLAGFGIFLALTLFSTDLAENTIGKYLSFIFMTLTLLIWLELWASFPSSNRSWQLIVFENLINAATILLFGYWLFGYYKQGKLFLFVIIGIGFLSIATKIQDKYRLLDFIKKTKLWEYSFMRYLFGFLFIFIIIIIAFGLSGLIMGGIDPYMHDIIKELGLGKIPNHIPK